MIRQSVIVPDALKQIATDERWVLWRWETRQNKKTGEAKPTKPPRMVKHGKICGYAHNDKPGTWSSLDDVLGAEGEADGIGLQLLGLTGIAALDLDDVRDEDGNLLLWAAGLIARAASYAELTPSGRGARIIGRVPSMHDTIHTKIDHPEGGHFEIYANLTEGRGRYITVTGDRIDGTPDALADLSAIVAELMKLRKGAGGEDGQQARFEIATARSGKAPDWIDSYLAGNGTGDRSADFQAIVNALRPRGWTFEDALRLFQDHPEGPAGKYADRLEAELRRSWDKAKAPGNGRDTTPDDAPPPDFRKLLAVAQALQPDQHDEIEAVVKDAAGLAPMRRDAILRAIKDATKIPLGTLRDQLKQDIDSGPDPDHLDLARATIEQIGAENVICADAFVWRWDECGVWRQQNDRAVKQLAQTAIDEVGEDVTANLVNGVSDVLKNEIFKPHHEFNLGNPESVNCTNGELDLEDGQWILKAHRRENYRTTQIPVAYDPDADAPMFRAFLAQVFRDDDDREEKARCALELIGYTLMSHARHEIFVMLIGPGANGKSVLLGMLEKLLGTKNVAGVQPCNFESKFQRAHLHQKLANIVTELKQGEVIADAELKAITSGELATVEHKFRDPFPMRPFATCWFGTNHMPHTRDFSEALFRRATILQLNRVFAKHEQDPTLKDKLADELPGILNLALRAYAQALVEGFTHPPSSEQAKQEWRLEADQVALFLEDCGERVARHETQASDVFRAYQSWAAENGIQKAMSQKGLRDRLTRLGFGSKRTGRARYVTGLRIRPSALGTYQW